MHHQNWHHRNVNEDIHPTVPALDAAKRRRDSAANRLDEADKAVTAAIKIRDDALRQAAASTPAPTAYALAKRFKLTPNGVRYILGQKKPKEPK